MANKNKKYKRSIEDANKIDTSFNYRHSSVDTRSDTTRKGYHEGNTYSYQSRSYHPFIDLYNSIDYYTNSTNPNSPRYKPGLITGIAPNVNIKDYAKIIKGFYNINSLQKSIDADKFVKFLSDKTGKSIKRIKIKDTKIGDVYSDGYSYVDDTGREIAHIAGTRRNNKVFVESSYVDPEFRSKGLGKQMYFDFNKQVFDKYGTTLHSSPYQHQTTLETSPGSGVFISPSSKLWRGLKQNNMATMQGKGLDKYYVMDIPSNIITKFKNGGIYKRSIEDAGRISDEEYYDIMEDVAARNYRDWGFPNEDAALLHALNDNAYNYKGYYNKYPNGDGNAKDHWTDEFKTVYHPTFSDESIYSGKKSQYNPNGLKGGYWIGENFMPASYQRTQIGENTFRPINWQRNKKVNGGVHYKVKKGDTLSKIAKQYTGNALRYDEIAKSSNIKNPDRLEIGQDIVIPQQFLDTIKDTNLPELVVTGNKKNTLINKLKIKAPNTRHEEKPSTLSVQRLQNRRQSLEELNKPNAIQRTIEGVKGKVKDVTDTIKESGNIQDFLQTAWNGVAKNFVEDNKVTTKKRTINTNKKQNTNSNVLDENFAKEIRNGTDTLLWDKVPIDRTGNKYYVQESYPITDNMRFGARNRGDYTPLNSNNAPLTAYRPFVKYENNKTPAVDGEGHQNHFMGFNKEGKFKIGPLSEFGPGDTMTQAFYFDVTKVARDKNGNIIYKEDINNPGRFQPVIEGYDENTYDKNGKLQRGVYKQSTITTMSKKRSLDGSYGNVSGGRVLLKCDNETRVVSGSIEHVIQELELMQKNHKGKPVRYYQLDNGSYNRGLRTRNGKNISEQDLRDYDKQNTTSAGGGHFMYIRN